MTKFMKIEKSLKKRISTEHYQDNREILIKTRPEAQTLLNHRNVRLSKISDPLRKMDFLFGLSLILSLSNPAALEYTRVHPLSVQTCAELEAAGYPVEAYTPDDEDIEYAMCVVKVSDKRQSVRRSYDRPKVEVGPGELKSTIIKYGPDFYENKVKFLIEKKMKIEAAQKRKQNMLAELEN